MVLFAKLAYAYLIAVAKLGHVEAAARVKALQSTVALRKKGTRLVDYDAPLHCRAPAVPRPK